MGVDRKVRGLRRRFEGRLRQGFHLRGALAADQAHAATIWVLGQLRARVEPVFVALNNNLSTQLTVGVSDADGRISWKRDFHALFSGGAFAVGDCTQYAPASSNDAG